MRLSLGIEIMAATDHSKKISQSLYTFRLKKKKKKKPSNFLLSQLTSYLKKHFPDLN